MLITALLLAAMAPSPAATVATTRAAYTKCLRTDLKTALEAKKAAADYEAALTTVCVTERSAFRAAVIAFDQSSGDSAAKAAENADMPIEAYSDNLLEKFKDYSETNTLPAE